jgi:hypothetical protein
MKHFVHLGQVVVMPKCSNNHMFDDWKKTRPQGCFAFFFPLSKVRILQKWKETLEEKKWKIEKKKKKRILNKKWIKRKEI